MEKRAKKICFWYDGAQAKHLAKDVETTYTDSDGSIADGNSYYFQVCSDVWNPDCL